MLEDRIENIKIIALEKANDCMSERQKMYVSNSY